MTKKQVSLIALGGAALFTAAATLQKGGDSANSSAWEMEVISSDWELDGFKNDLDISGIASVNGSRCLIVSDEGLHVQPGLIDLSNQNITATGAVKVSPIVKSKGSEIDFEGATYSESTNSYFVVGSHGLGGKDSDFDPNRFSVFQIGVDSTNGRIDEGDMKRASLLPWIEANPITAPFVRQPLDENGFDIEGIATVGDQLYFGLRGPNHEGDCLVLQIGITTLFEATKGDLIVHRLPLGEGRGLRDITPVQGGFLFIAGNGSAKVNGKKPKKRYDLFFWDGQNAKPENIGTLPKNAGKAEALLVLEDSADEIDVIVLFDSLPGGAPIQIRLRRTDQLASN
ncbi:DUF3616 domain-containing protein [Verrucomicrobiaceae bacterium 227]